MRPPLEERFLRLAEYWATWSTCHVKHGAVIAVGNRVVSQGFNGSAPGEPHCIDVGCQFFRGHCIRSVHAEVNAIEWARKIGAHKLFLDATMYVTGSPCPDCQAAIEEAGIRRVVYRAAYRGVVPQAAGIEWIEWGWGRNSLGSSN